MENPITTITLSLDTWRSLNALRYNPKMTFDDLINNLINFYKDYKSENKVKVVCDEKDCEEFTYMEQIKNWKCDKHLKNGNPKQNI